MPCGSWVFSGAPRWSSLTIAKCGPETSLSGSWLFVLPMMCSMLPGSPEQYTSVGSTTVVSPPRVTVTLLSSGRSALPPDSFSEPVDSSESESESESPASGLSLGSSALSPAASSLGSLSAGAELVDSGEAGSSEPVGVQAATAARTAAQMIRVGVDRFTALSKRSDDGAATAREWGRSQVCLADPRRRASPQVRGTRDAEHTTPRDGPAGGSEVAVPSARLAAV